MSQKTGEEIHIQEGLAKTKTPYARRRTLLRVTSIQLSASEMISMSLRISHMEAGLKGGRETW